MDNISKIIKQDGKIKLTQSQFSNIISKYYKKQYNLNVVFKFLPISYECLDEHLVYDYSLGMDTVTSLKKKINSFIPCLIDLSMYEQYKNYKISILGVIKNNELNDELKRVLPLEIIVIDNSDIEHIFNDFGLSIPLYDFFYNGESEELEYSANVKKFTLNK